jgi:hypothetical protein
MALPVDIITLADLNTAYTAEKVMQQLGTKGKNAPDADRVKLVIESAIGFVMGQIQRAVVKSSVYDLWVSRWRDDDRAEIRRLVLSAAGYYMHYYGQKGDEIPDSVTQERDNVEPRCKDIGDHVATIGAEPQPESSTQHEFIYGPSVGNNPIGAPRNLWGGY